MILSLPLHYLTLVHKLDKQKAVVYLMCECCLCWIFRCCCLHRVLLVITGLIAGHVLLFKRVKYLKQRKRKYELHGNSFAYSFVIRYLVQYPISTVQVCPCAGGVVLQGGGHVGHGGEQALVVELVC